jgi:two-component system capsular synthesis sensor histidine kinase RcsC
MACEIASATMLSTNAHDRAGARMAPRRAPLAALLVAARPGLAMAASAETQPLLPSVTGVLVLIVLGLAALLVHEVRTRRRLRTERDAAMTARERLSRRHGRLRGWIRARSGRLAAAEHERRDARRRLREARRQLAERDELVAALGHEVRSPLRSLLGMIDVLGRDPPAAGDPRLGAVRDLAAHVLRVAEDSLDLARLERDEVHLDAAPFDLETELGRVLDAVSPLPDRRVPVLVDLEPGLPLGWSGDAPRIRQVLINLVGNALRNTDHGVITLSVERRLAPDGLPEGLRVLVADSGAGIAPAAQQRLFTPFEQGRGAGRAGLGLAVVDRLVALMDGSIRFDSEMGVGTRFEVELPLTPTDPVFPRIDLSGRRVVLCAEHLVSRHALAGYLRHWGARVEEAADAGELEALVAGGPRPDAVILEPSAGGAALEQAVDDWRRHGVLVVAPGPESLDAHRALWPSALAAALTAPPLPVEGDAGAPEGVRPGLHVLVVDDHPVARRVLSSLLSDLGCAVMVAEDGESALEIGDDPEETFDVVLLDRYMPGIDGVATAAALRTRRATRDARLVLLVNDRGAARGEHRVVDAVLVRPEGAAALGAALARELRTAPAASAEEATDPALATLRDRTLGEDVSGALGALERNDSEGIDDHLHRMRGALRVCPHPARAADLDAIRSARAGGDPAALRDALETAARNLRAEDP